ncbi:MAG TPA: LCP family protein [Candidatus Saccharimonadia bacterium]|nr:LCP family protein [Candidatus Saccharimonadia bacterium]
MDRNRRKRPKSIDGFIPSRQHSSLSQPFSKIKNVGINQGARLIPKRQSINLGQHINPESAENIPSARLALSNNLNTASKEDLQKNLRDINKPTRRQRRVNKQLEDVRKKSKLKKTLKYSALFIIVAFLFVGSYVGFNVFHNLDKVFGGNIISDISSLFKSTTVKGQSGGRINILLAGDSADQLNHGGQQLTDSILVASIDTKNHTAFFLSIPRDLWVNIPGWGWQKINAANDNMGTNFPGYPQNGMGQLQHIVTTNLGIPIDYYALSNYGAFRDAVNAVGGVTVDIKSPDPRGLFDAYTHLKLPNGEDFLNGQEALNLARARGDGAAGDVSYGFPDSDFDRTQHQRQLFVAIAKKAQSIGVITNPVRVSDLFNALGNNVETDLSLQDVLELIKLTKGMDLSTIKSYAYCSTLTIGQDGCTKPIITDYRSSSGEDALIPSAGVGNYIQLQQYYNQLISSNPVVTENASAIVLNGTTTNGLASTYQTILNKKGIDVSSIGDTINTYAKSEIIDNSSGKDPNTKKYLESLFGDTIVASTTANNPTGANFVIIIGLNQKLPTATK